MPPNEQKNKWFLDTRDILKGNYFIPYEISNFSKKVMNANIILIIGKLDLIMVMVPQHTVMMELKDGKI